MANNVGYWELRHNGFPHPQAVYLNDHLSSGDGGPTPAQYHQTHPLFSGNYSDLSGAPVANYVAVDGTDLASLTTSVTNLRDALIAAGLMAAQ